MGLYRACFLAVLLLVEPAAGAALRAAGGHRHRGQVAGGTNGGSQAVETAAAKAKSSLAEVIELLTSMLHEFDTQAVQDRENWESYSTWSQDSESEKRTFIQQQQALVMSTTALLNANRQEVQTLTADLAQLATDISEEQASLHELTTMRHDEHTQFQASLEDVSKTITAVTKATGILEGHYGTPTAALLSEVRAKVQVALTMFGRKTASATPQNVKLLSSMLQVGGQARNPDFLNTDGSQYATYEHAAGSRGVIGMLEDLNAQLEGQRNDLIATESAAQREYEATKATKEANLAHMSHVQDAKIGRKAESEATIKQCLSTIDQAEHEIVESQAYIKQLLEDRATFQEEFNTRVAMRTQERGATQAALDALQSVSAGAKSNVGLLQSSGIAPLFLELSLDTRVRLSLKASTRLRQTLTNLIKLGNELKQPVLAQLAAHLKQDYATAEQSTFFDNSKFAPVLKLLNDLITRLEEEAAAETSQHQWCETEKETSEAAKEQREKATHALMATIESLTTNIATLKTEVEFLASEILRTEEETRIAKDIRSKEHEVYVQAKADHEEVIGAIQQALAALGGQYALLQQPGGASPFAAYSSGQAGAASAQEMLTDLLGRYTEALHTIIADEEAAVKAHEDLLARNAQFVEDCTHSKNAKTSERRGLINELSDDKGEIKTNLIELHEVGKYLMDLRPACDDIRSTFEERSKRREAEIAALREALQVISDPTAV